MSQTKVHLVTKERCVSVDLHEISRVVGPRRFYASDVYRYDVTPGLHVTVHVRNAGALDGPEYSIYVPDDGGEPKIAANYKWVRERTGIYNQLIDFTHEVVKTIMARPLSFEPQPKE